MPTLRAVVTEAGARGVASFAEAGGDISDDDVRGLVAALAEHAPALLPLAVADPTLPRDVLDRPLSRGDSDALIREMFHAATRGLHDGPELARVLRRLRHRIMVRIAMREVLRLADVDQSSAELSSLASAAIDAALRCATADAFARFGTPRAEDGRAVSMTVLGMGKLGGSELNPGSDVDLMFFYGTDDATVVPPAGAHTDDGQGRDDDLTPHGLFARIARRTTRLLADVTEDGFCFRVDLRLRPEGSGGPIVNSLESAERYYASFGRPWERAALLRARPIAGDIALGERLLRTLRPFVFRREVDPRIADEMTQMVVRSRRELHADPKLDIKLGRGGIREAEFFVQTLQLIWGGQHPELQVTSTPEALRRLRVAGLISHRDSAALGANWALLRRIEHRIHFKTGYQTHDLPRPGPERERFARSLGFADASEFDRHLGAARRHVATLFDSLTDGAREEPDANDALDALIDRVSDGAAPDELADDVAAALAVQDSLEAASYLTRLARHAYSPLGPVGRQRAPRLASILLDAVRDAGHPDSALRFLAEFFTRVGREWSYDRLLESEPHVARRLVMLFGSSATLSRSLVGHPEAIDEVLTVHGRLPSVDEIRAAHDLPELAVDPLADIEQTVATLRRIRRELTLRIGLAYVAGEAPIEVAQARLSALADAQIERAYRYAEREQTQRFGRPSAPEGGGSRASMVVVGMGKLGGRELGFTSDLDLMFVFSAEGETEAHGEQRSITHGELFARIAQRTMRLLSQHDEAGRGYEVDTRLRPSGSKGMLVVSVEGFERYHQRHAAAWERQALLRARVVAGDALLAGQFTALAAHIAYDAPAEPGEQLANMRRRIEEELAREQVDRHHPKVGYGALVDVEFITQYLQMVHGADHAVRHRNTLDALRALRERGYLGARDAEALEEAYLFFREVEQSLALLDEAGQASLLFPGPRADAVARRLRIRERDGHAPGRVLRDVWRREATEVREIFERIVAPVGIEAPWGRASRRAEAT